MGVYHETIVHLSANEEHEKIFVISINYFVNKLMLDCPDELIIPILFYDALLILPDSATPHSPLHQN